MMATSTQAELAIPPLVDGDHLSQEEFERRYDAMPDLKKAELIEGVVFMGSPVGITGHSKPHGYLSAWVVGYQSATPGTDMGIDGSVRLDAANMRQPDAFLMILPECGGQSRIGPDDYLVGGPEFAAEVASSSLKNDLQQKFESYRRNGTKEYLVWRMRDRAFDWFVLRQGAYVRLEPSPDGLLRSEFFPGLWLDPEAMIRYDFAAVSRSLQLGLGTPEHSAFVAKLAASTREGRP